MKTEPPQIVLLLLLFLTQIDETAMPMSTQPYDLIGTDPVPSHLGVNSRRLRHHRPSSTHNCECSGAPKKSTRAKVRSQIKLKTQEARRNNVQISKDSRRATGASPVSTKPSTVANPFPLSNQALRPQTKSSLEEFNSVFHKQHPDTEE